MTFSWMHLIGMQAVRATFTLPKHAINLISTVASQLGVKQKSIFDHLIENKEIIDQIADESKQYESEKIQRRQKTFVLSRNCLSTLDTFAREYKQPREVLVITPEKQRHENRKVLLAQMQGFRKLESFFSQYDKAMDELEAG